jgi:protein gp37
MTVWMLYAILSTGEAGPVPVSENGCRKLVADLAAGATIEPLIEPLTFARPDLFQWVVIGGASRSNETPEWQPPFEWVARLYLTFKDAGARVYIKDNIGFNGPRRPREYPWQQPEMQSAADVFHYLKNRSDA